MRYAAEPANVKKVIGEFCSIACLCGFFFFIWKIFFQMVINHNQKSGIPEGRIKNVQSKSPLVEKYIVKVSS